jgi:phage N-6-adenine-methyltransferase
MNAKTIKLFQSRKSDHWQTPKDFYNNLNNEFNFDFDPCPFKHDISKWDGLKVKWGKRNFINPPYSNVEGWLKKAHLEIKNGNADLCVFLVFANTDTKWFHNYCYNKAELRFIKGRLCFINQDGKTDKTMRAMRPSMLVILKK